MVPAKVRETIAKYGLLERGDSVLLGVSGGPDSVALLHCLVELGDFEVQVAHVMHGIRGEEARRDAEFVAALSDRLELRFHLHEADIPRRKIESRKGNIEALGREERYRFFAAAAKQSGCRRIATAHTRDDQVETVLMWLLRGGGRKGLGGMPPIRPLDSTAGLKLVRPLIECSKTAVLNYLAAQGLQYRTDETNSDTIPLRNWIRLELLPQLRRRIDSRLDERLAHLSEIFREEDKVLDAMAAGVLKTFGQDRVLARDCFSRTATAVQRRVMRLWIEQATGGLRGVTFDQVEDCLRLSLTGPAQGRVSLPGGWELVREYEDLRLEKKRVKRTGEVCYTYTLAVGGELLVREAGVRIRSSLPNAPRRFLRNEHEAIFDLDRLEPVLTVRNFRAGDRFRPLGMTGHKKVKDLFIDKKVPLATRRTLPFLLSGSEILWIPGYGRSDLAKVSPGTKQIVSVEFDFLG